MHKGLDKGGSAVVYLHHNPQPVAYCPAVINMWERLCSSLLRIVVINYQHFIKGLSTVAACACRLVVVPCHPLKILNSYTMQFTQIPTQHAALGGTLRYVVQRDQAATIDIRIYDDRSGELIGAKRFAATTEASFDAAPYLRRAVRFVPAVGATGVLSAVDRCIAARIEAQCGAELVTAAVRTFLPAEADFTAPALLTGMPHSRLIAAGECDELTLLTDAAGTICVTAQVEDALVAENYAIPAAGVWLFRLAADDFPGAESLTVDAGECGVVVYSCIAQPTGAQRLAWRSRAGSIEHYTFPVEHSAGIAVAKQRVEGGDGSRVTRVARRDVRRLVSAYEVQPMSEAVAEVIGAPEVWAVDAAGYVPVDVATTEATVRRIGELCALEIEVCSTQNKEVSWN